MLVPLICRTILTNSPFSSKNSFELKLNTNSWRTRNSPPSNSVQKANAYASPVIVPSLTKGLVAAALAAIAAIIAPTVINNRMRLISATSL